MSAENKTSHLGDYYSAAQLRSDRWSALKDTAQRLALADAEQRLFIGDVRPYDWPALPASDQPCERRGEGRE